MVIKNKKIKCNRGNKLDVRVFGSDEKDANYEEVDYELALDLAGYGPGSRRALAACCAAFLVAGLQNGLNAYLVPAARCDLALSTYQMGLANTAFMLGGAASAVACEAVARAAGRRAVLAGALATDAALAAAAGAARAPATLLAARALSGAAVGLVAALTLPYLADLVGRRRRTAYFCIVGLCFTAAWLILPGVSWWVVGTWSWRWLARAAALPSAAAAALLLALPANPRRLSPRAAARALATLYAANTARPDHLYPVRCVVADVTAEEGALSQLRMLFGPKLWLKTTVVAFAFFVNMCGGFGLGLWIPEMLSRVHAQRDAAPAALCVALDAAPAPNDTARLAPCSDHIELQVYVESGAVGAACVAGTALAALWRGGARGAAAALLATGALAAVAPHAPPRAAAPLLAGFQAAALTGNVLLMQLVIHVLPERVGSLGMCAGALSGRLGGVLSNLLLGTLLDVACVAPFTAVAVLSAVAGLAVAFLRPEGAQAARAPPADVAAHM